VKTTTLMAMVLAVAAGLATQARAAEAAAERRSRMDREVQALLGELRASQCRFNRNGTWYDGADAAQHLAKKYDYLRARLEKTEQFIAKGGSSSSMSGKAYLVQCGSARKKRSASGRAAAGSRRRIFRAAQGRAGTPATCRGTLFGSAGETAAQARRPRLPHSRPWAAPASFETGACLESLARNP
jgi:hypothetical protein